jgi:23S rRNA (cytosine1962-C5)-methyltransferase
MKDAALPTRRSNGQDPPAAAGKQPGNRPNLVRLRLRIARAAERQLRAGHPWVFADSICEQNRTGTAGELAVVFDRNDHFLAVGLFDPHSPIRVRVLHAGKPQTIDSAWWAARLEAAVRRRDGLFDERTTGYRLINGESDGWPGLVLDRYDTTLVIKVYTAAWRPRLEEIAALVWARMKPERVVLRISRNVQDILHSRRVPPSHVPALRSRRGNEADSIVSQGLPPPHVGGCEGEGEPSSAGPRTGKWWMGGLTDGQTLIGHRLEACPTFLESGLQFEADVLRGQKTGFFLDQRENRRLVETLAQDRAMLNAFSFSGGFSLYAARGGAKSVTDLDISAYALEAAKRNFNLNQPEAAVARCRHELVKADAFAWLAGNPKRKFDLIVLDPPSLARREAERAGAIRAYARLTELGIKHLAPGGILLACSCSAHVSAEEFFQAVRQTAAKSGRRFPELQSTLHAPDHPATFKEAEYLKAICLKTG